LGIRKSIALKWDREQDDAPRMIASGKGPLAERIIQLAQDAGIPVLEDPVLAGILADSPAGTEIPPELYQLAAEVYIFLLELEQQEGSS